MSAKSRGNYPHYPREQWACERCCFGTGEHAEWCERPKSWSDYMRKHGREEYELWEAYRRKLTR